VGKKLTINQSLSECDVLHGVVAAGDVRSKASKARTGVGEVGAPCSCKQIGQLGINHEL